MTETEEDLARSLRGDDGERALKALYRASAPELYGFALQRLGDRQLAEEVVQDTFTRVWRHAAEFDARRARFRTWLWSIARNAVVDAERRRSARPPSASERAASGEPATSDDSLERELLRWQVRSALDRLTPEHREILALAHFGGLTLREIADRKGLPLGTVKSRTSYALRNLRLALDEMGVEP